MLPNPPYKDPCNYYLGLFAVGVVTVFVLTGPIAESTSAKFLKTCVLASDNLLVELFGAKAPTAGAAAFARDWLNLNII